MLKNDLLQKNRQTIDQLMATARPQGWVMEPDAKSILKLAGITVPRFSWAKTADQAANTAAEIGYPLAAKVVSPAIIHKSDAKGVKVGIRDQQELLAFFEQCSRLPDFQGLVVEEMVSGVELIIGASIDQQFGPIVLLGIGGTGVELYQDVAIRMAPLTSCDVTSMSRQLTAAKLLSGYRGSAPVNMEALTAMMLSFSALVMELADVIESIDLNPVFCTKERCVVADARIMLAGVAR